MKYKCHVCHVFHLEKIGNFIFISRILVFNNKIIAALSTLMEGLVQGDMSTYNDYQIFSSLKIEPN